jgi:hypothetical protein
MTSQNYTEQELKNMMPVFHLKPVSNSRTKCTLTMYAENTERLSDDQLEVETTQEIKEKIGNNTLLLGTVNSNVIIGKYCACNIPGNFLISNTKLPIYYLSIIYNKKFVTGCLFNIFLYFTIDDETKQRLNEPKKYYKALMDGKFTIQCVPTDEDYIDKVKFFIERDVMMKYQDEFSKDTSIEYQDKIMDLVVEDINKELESFRKFFEEKEYQNKFPSQKNVFQVLNDICSSPEMKKLVTYGLDIREKERFEEKCPDMSYEAPKNIINLREIKENPEKLDEIFAQRQVCVENE